MYLSTLNDLKYYVEDLSIGSDERLITWIGVIDYFLAIKICISDMKFFELDKVIKSTKYSSMGLLQSPFNFT